MLGEGFQGKQFKKLDIWGFSFQHLNQNTSLSAKLSVTKQCGDSSAGMQVLPEKGR